MLQRCLAVASLLLIPLAGAQAAAGPAPVDTELYFHVISTQDFPINTQLPDMTWTSQSFGGQATLSCAAPVTGNLGGAENEYHTYYGYSSPALVEYGIVANGMPRIHPARGLGKDVLLDPASVPTLHWFLATNGVEGNGASSGAIPNVVVKATLRDGDAISIDDIAYNTGDIVMQGLAGPATLVGGRAIGPDGQNAEHVTPSMAGNRQVYEFAFPLDVIRPWLRSATGFNVRIDVYVENPACADPANDGSMMPGLVEPFSDPAHLARLDLRHPPAMVAEGPVRVTPVKGVGLSLAWNVSDAWGAYDVNVAAETLEIRGPGDPPFLFRQQVIQRTHEAHGNFEPVQTQWIWDFKDQAPADGTYNVTFRVPNLQGTEVAESTMELRLRDGRIVTGPEQSLPAMPLLPLAMVAALVGATLRRR